jgi:hypothetical protein
MIAGITFYCDVINDGGDAEASIGGPAIYAALGHYVFSNQFELLTKTGYDLDLLKTQISHMFNGKQFQPQQSTRKTLRFTSRKVLGETGEGRMNDFPFLYHPSMPHDFSCKRLVCTNSDPDWLIEVLRNVQSSEAWMDLGIAWCKSKPKAVFSCMSRCALIFMTAYELDLLQAFDRRRVTELLELGGMFAVKEGRRGVRFITKNWSCQLAAPVADDISCDVGAGDFLFGAFSASLRSQISLADQNEVTAAYKACGPWVGKLLQSSSPGAFVSSMMDFLECKLPNL